LKVTFELGKQKLYIKSPAVFLYSESHNHEGELVDFTYTHIGVHDVMAIFLYSESHNHWQQGCFQVCYTIDEQKDWKTITCILPRKIQGYSRSTAYHVESDYLLRLAKQLCPTDNPNKQKVTCITKEPMCDWLIRATMSLDEGNGSIKKVHMFVNIAAGHIVSHADYQNMFAFNWCSTI